MDILADIGGTYVRFALAGAAGPEHVQKYRAEKFETFEDALDIYKRDLNLSGRARLRIATAGYDDGGVWKFVNKNKWVVDPAALTAAGWDVAPIMNDFEAATWALAELHDDEIDVLKGAPGASSSLCLLGPGTGLGLGYLHQTDAGPYVQKTHGGHIPAACVTDEQWIVLQTVRRLLGEEHVGVFENVVSGPGIFNLHQALCYMSGKESGAASTEDVMQRRDEPEVQNALRLFHEFLGLFAASVVVAGHAYGGLYMTGGMIPRLKDAGVFDFETFEQFFCLNAVDSVRRDLRATPVKHITLPYPALKGLMVKR